MAKRGRPKATVPSVKYHIVLRASAAAWVEAGAAERGWSPGEEMRSIVQAAYTAATGQPVEKDSELAARVAESDKKLVAASEEF